MECINDSCLGEICAVCIVRWVYLLLADHNLPHQLLLPPQIHDNPDSIPIVSFNNFPTMLILGFPENFRDSLNSPIPFLQLIERMPFLKKPDDFWVFKAGSLPACLPKCPHIYLPTCPSACLRPSAGTIGPSSLFILFWHLMSFEVHHTGRGFQYSLLNDLRKLSKCLLG